MFNDDAVSYQYKTIMSEMSEVSSRACQVHVIV